jgi:hypothetical protein
MLGAHSVAFSPDGNALASEEILMGSLYLWPAPSWEEIDAAEAMEKVKAPRQSTRSVKQHYAQ